ncbi:MAG TPA: Hsp20/alpha crystallin family protein [Vicinamibacteria bacterium]|nr:Hsp20/alpha crystallin family protein [Vicinamibacteria bacterium]
MSVIRRPARTARLDLAVLQREVHQLLERLADLDRTDPPAEGEWMPSVDVYECDGKLTVVAEVPGLSADSLRVTVRDRNLVIGGERRERRPAGAATFLCMERPQGRFTRMVTLDVPVDVRSAEAHLAGGILTVILPRLKDRRGRATVIPVQREDPAP